MIAPSHSTVLYYFVAYPESKAERKRAKDLRYRHTERGKQKRKEWNESPEGRYSMMRSNLRRRIKVRRVRIAELERTL